MFRYTEVPVPDGGFIITSQCHIKENPNKLIPISYILRIILNCKTSTAHLTLTQKMLNDVMLHTKLGEWKNNYFSYLDIYTGQHIICINNSVIYLGYIICKRSITRSYHTVFIFFHTRPQALAQFDAKKRIVLHINEEGYTK